MYKITAIPRINNTWNPYFANLSFAELAKFICRPREGIKKDRECTIPAWSPASFNGMGLSSEHVTEISCMVYDIDDGLTWDTHELFYMFQYIAYTSPSHSCDHHKWRLILPFDEPVPVQYWGLVWEHMVDYFEQRTNSLLNGGNIDKTCKDPRRFYFFGKKSKWFESHINSNGYAFWVNLDEIKQKKAEQERAQQLALEKQRAKLRELQKKPLRNRDVYNELRMNLNLRSDYRETLAHRIGGRITQGTNPRVVGWECPQCHRSDCTFYYVNPVGNKLGAFCNHRNSCGMSMGLFQLGRIKGVF